MFVREIEGYQGVETSESARAERPSSSAASRSTPAESSASSRTAACPPLLERLPKRDGRSGTAGPPNAQQNVSPPICPALLPDATLEQRQAEVDRALAYGKLWQTLVNQGAIDDSAQADKFVRQGLESASLGLETLTLMLATEQIGESVFRSKGKLLILHHAQVAEYGIKFRHWQAGQWTQARPRRWQAASDPASANTLRASEARPSPETPTSRPSQRSHAVQVCGDAGERPRSSIATIEAMLREIAAAREQLAECEGIMQRFLDWCGVESREPEAAAHLPVAKRTLALAEQARLYVNVEALHMSVFRLELCGISSPEISAQVEAFQRIIDGSAEGPSASMARVRSAKRTVEQAHQYDARAVAEAKAVMFAHFDEIDTVGERLCIEAASRIEMNDRSDIWRYAIDMANAISTYTTALREYCERARAGRGTATADVPVQSSQQAARVRQRSAGRSASGSRHGGATTTASSRQPSSPASRTPVAPPSEPPRSEAHRRARRGIIENRLAHYPVERKMAERFGGDPVAIGRELGRDTSSLEWVRAPRFDPLDAANFARTSVSHWFGSIEHLRTDLEHAQRVGRAHGDAFFDRMQALKQIDDHVLAQEADALKVIDGPKAKHLRRLLALKEIAHIGAPVSLNSANDPQSAGKLFEMRIELRPLTSGARAAPFFVHLHTEEAVDTRSVRTLPYQAFSAVHVKTAQQRKLGGKWEPIANAMRVVHRGKIDAALLDDLRARIQPDVADMLQAVSLEHDQA